MAEGYKELQERMFKDLSDQEWFYDRVVIEGYLKEEWGMTWKDFERLSTQGSITPDLLREAILVAAGKIPPPPEKTEQN